MDSELEHMLGGGLRPGDSRRYLIEAMVAAMRADGRVDPRELEVLHGHLARHELFAQLSDHAARMLVDMATDAVRLSDDGRAGAIARGLPTRTHRLAAYAMACEVCVADGHLHHAEAHYLNTLLGALRLSEREASGLFEGARLNRPMDALADAIARLGRLTPRIVDGFALQHCMERRLLRRQQRRLRDMLVGLTDIHASAERIQAEIDRAFDPLDHGRNVPRAMERLAGDISDPADRYWLAVYMAAGYRHRGAELAELIHTPFWELLAQAFELAAHQQAISEHAALLVPAPAPPPGRHSSTIG